MTMKEVCPTNNERQHMGLVHPDVGRSSSHPELLEPKHELFKEVQRRFTGVLHCSLVRQGGMSTRLWVQQLSSPSSTPLWTSGDCSHNVNGLLIGTRQSFWAIYEESISKHNGHAVWEYPSWISLWWWLSICHLEGNFYFWILQKVFKDLFQRSHFFSSSANLKAWLPINWCPSLCICLAQRLASSSHTFSQFIRPMSLLSYTSKLNTDCV